MFGLGAGEVLLILLFALIFIGPKKLPELAKGLGKGIREFQKAKDELMNEVKSSTTDQVTQGESKSLDQNQETSKPLPTGEEAHGNDPFISPEEDKPVVHSDEEKDPYEDDAEYEKMMAAHNEAQGNKES